MRPVGMVASSGRTTGQVLAAPAPAGTAGPAAQVPKAGAATLQATDTDGRVRSRNRAGKAVKQRQQHPTCATAQSIVCESIASMERAADALDAMLMEAPAATESRQAFEFFQLAFILLLKSCSDDAYAAAQQLHRSASAWRAAQDIMRASLVWAVNQDPGTAGRHQSSLARQAARVFLWWGAGKATSGRLRGILRRLRPRGGLL